MKYRPEIDGLRSLAVIPVIFFHAGFDVFSGGYVGVDVFFVISGYLITTIILAEKERGTFSLVNFYERRARRILPALFLVMLVTLPFAWLWLTPSEMKDFSRSLVAVSTFTSNILFWLESGYWGAANELKPLLHTWSLAVEEQYYVLFPLFLMMMWRFRKRWILSSFMVIAATSLAIAQWGAYNIPTANFFLLHTRVWELAIGASIAFYFLYRKQTIRTLLSHKSVDEALGLVGLLLIGYAVYEFDETIPFPSFYTLIPTTGAGLIILFSSSQTLIGRLLGTKLLVSIGLISYSAYLWHQPLFAFARHRTLTEPSELLFMVLALLSFPLAYLSWRYVEKPFRTKGVFSRKTIFTFAVVGSAFFITVGLTGHLTDGWPGRMDERFLRAMPENNEDLSCSSKVFNPKNICKLVQSQNKLTYLIGDSHAKAISNEMQIAFSKKNIGLLHSSYGGCPPIRNVYRADLGSINDVDCYIFNEEMYRFIYDNKDIEYVVMVARWTSLIEGTRFDNTEGGIESPTPTKKPHLDLVTNGKPEYHPNYSHRKDISERYVDSIQELLDLGKKVILVYPIPEAGWNVTKYIYKYYIQHSDQAFSPNVGSTSHEVFKTRNRRSYIALDSVGQQPNLFRVYPEHIFCSNEVSDRCVVQNEVDLYYWDEDHLSSAGAKLVAKEIIKNIE